MKSRPLNSHRLIRLMVIFFKIIGLATFSVRNVVSEKRSKLALIFVSSKLGCYYNWILVLVMIGSNFTLILTRIDIHTIFLCALNNLAVGTILVSCCVNQTDLVRIGNHLIDIEWELRRLLHPVKRGSTSLVRTVVYLLNGCLGLAAISFKVLNNQQNRSDWFLGLITKFCVCWFIIQYFFVVSFVHAAFVDVNRALLGVSRNWSTNFQPESLREARRIFVSSSSMQFILQLRNLHERLCVVSIEISQFYSVPILPAITFCFFWLIYKLYDLSVYISLEVNRLDIMLLTDPILKIVYLMYPILLLSHEITDTVGEIRRTGRLVHLLLNCAIGEDSRAELKQFSLQLLHYRVEFTANGYFVLNNALVHSMVCALSTYLVILIQFGPIDLKQVSTSLTERSHNCSCDDREGDS